MCYFNFTARPKLWVSFIKYTFPIAIEQLVHAEKEKGNIFTSCLWHKNVCLTEIGNRRETLNESFCFVFRRCAIENQFFAEVLSNRNETIALHIYNNNNNWTKGELKAVQMKYMCSVDPCESAQCKKEWFRFIHPSFSSTIGKRIYMT